MPLCLHCSINTAIEAYFEEAGERHGELVVQDTAVILDALVDVLAEVLAIEPDDQERRAICLEFSFRVLKRSQAMRKAGQALAAVLKLH